MVGKEYVGTHHLAGADDEGREHHTVATVQRGHVAINAEWAEDRDRHGRSLRPLELSVNQGFTAVIPDDDPGGTAWRDESHGKTPTKQLQQEATMSIKLISGFGILATVGLLVTACGDEPEVDVESGRGAPPIVERWEGWPHSPADAAVRAELAKLKTRNPIYISADAAERAALAAANQRSESWPYSPAEAAVRAELEELKLGRQYGSADAAERALTADD